MSPVLTPLVSALERAAALIDRGLKPQAALRQVAKELTEHETAHGNEPIPVRPFALGDDRMRQPQERVI